MIRTSTRIVGALALAAALVSSAPESAAKPAQAGPGLIGDLNSPVRNMAVVKVPVDCDPAGANQTKTAKVSVIIFQPSGRLLNIGTGSVESTEQPPLICTGSKTEIDVTVNAIPGLAFKPGPATILIKLTETTTTTTPNLDPNQPPLVEVDVDETESGARVDLRP